MTSNTFEIIGHDKPIIIFKMINFTYLFKLLLFTGSLSGSFLVGKMLKHYLLVSYTEKSAQVRLYLLRNTCRRKLFKQFCYEGRLIGGSISTTY